MYFGPPVDRGRFSRFGKPVHRAHGSDSKATDIFAEKERRVDVHQYCFVSTHIESVGACDAGTFQQRINCHGIAVGLLRCEVDVGENRELLCAIRYGDVHRNAAGRETILIELSDGSKIGGAEKRDPVVLAPIKSRLIA